jgi:hypothetical protein
VPAGKLTEIDIQNNDIGDAVNATVLNPPAHGTAQIAPNGSLIYQSQASFGGTDIVKYQVCSMVSPDVCASATVTITVLAAAPLRIPGAIGPPLGSDLAAILLGWAAVGLIIAAGTLYFSTRRLRNDSTVDTQPGGVASPWR